MLCQQTAAAGGVWPVLPKLLLDSLSWGRSELSGGVCVLLGGTRWAREAFPINMGSLNVESVLPSIRRCVTAWFLQWYRHPSDRRAKWSRPAYCTASGNRGCLLLTWQALYLEVQLQWLNWAVTSSLSVLNKSNWTIALLEVCGPKSQIWKSIFCILSSNMKTVCKKAGSVARYNLYCFSWMSEQTASLLQRL